MNKVTDDNEAVKIATLASGSGGNSTVVAFGRDILLTDCGISCKRITEGLKSLGIEPSDLKGVLITHEHKDHIAGLKILMKRYRLPVFATLGTLTEITRFNRDMDKSLMYKIDSGKSFRIGDVRVNSFSIPHDAAEPVGFTFEGFGKKLAVCTDIGRITDEITENLRNSSAMVVEANHDVRMLEAGAYPYSLKRRILSDIGHLSNENSGKLISEVWHEGLKHIFLGHLSSENNLPELAKQTVKCELMERNIGYESITVIETAKKDTPSEMISV